MKKLKPGKKNHLTTSFRIQNYQLDRNTQDSKNRIPNAAPLHSSNGNDSHVKREPCSTPAVVIEDEAPFSA